jgi:SP family sugar:H+ symporter-like MFS transporter
MGALFGSLLAGVISGKYGIKVAYLFSLFIFMVGIAVQVSCQEQWGQMFAGRIIAGYGVGSLSMLAPLYQANCSPRHLRGMITSTYQLAATIGMWVFVQAVLSPVAMLSARNRSRAMSETIRSIRD